MATQTERKFATRIDIAERSRDQLVLEYVNTVAERATALGRLALGTARLAAAHSSLDEYPLDAVAGMDTVDAITDRLAAYGASTQAAIETAIELDDQGTGDLLIETRTIDKNLWVVEANQQA